MQLIYLAEEFLIALPFVFHLKNANMTKAKNSPGTDCSCSGYAGLTILTTEVVFLLIPPKRSTSMQSSRSNHLIAIPGRCHNHGHKNDCSHQQLLGNSGSFTKQFIQFISDPKRVTWKIIHLLCA